MGAESSRVSELIWRGDNRSAVKALLGIKQASTETKDTLKTNSVEEEASMERVRRSSVALRDSFGSLAGMIGIGGVAFGLKDLVEGGLALQGAQTNLRASLKETGNVASGVFEQMQQAAEELSTHGGFTTPESLQGMANFVRETRSSTQAVKLNALATDIARARNIDYATAQQAVARAYTGSVGRLQQLLGPMIAAREAQVGLTTAHAQEIATLSDQASMMGKMGSIWLRQQEVNDHITAQQAALAQLTDKHTTATEALATATKLFGGYAQNVYSNTTQGKLENFHHQLQNLEESLGEDLLPALTKVIGVLSTFATFLGHNKTLVLALLGPIAALTLAWGGLKILQGIRTMALELAAALKITGTAGQTAGAEAAAGAEEATLAWSTFMKATIVGLVLVGLVELIDHWNAVRDAVISVWHAIEHAAASAWNGIKTAAQDAVHFITHIFDSVWHGIVTGAKWVAKEVKSVLGTLGFTGNGIASYINPFGLAGHLFGALGFAHGGVVPRYFAAGGPTGTDTVPAWLTPDEGVVTTDGMDSIGGPAGLAAINAGRGLAPNVTISPNPQAFVLRTSDREIGEGTLRWVLNKAARGPSTLVGGSLVIGAPGLPA